MPGWKDWKHARVGDARSRVHETDEHSGGLGGDGKSQAALGYGLHGAVAVVSEIQERLEQARRFSEDGDGLVRHVPYDLASDLLP